MLGHRQAHGGQYRGVPGAEVLGGELPAGDLAQVGVDVGRGHVVPAAAGPIGEQAVSVALAPLEASHDRLDVGVHHGLLSLLGTLGEVVEHQLAAAAGHVLAADGGDAEGAVFRRVLLAAGPEEAEVDQAGRRGQDPFPPQATAGQVLVDRVPQAREDSAELQHPVMLVPVAPLPPQVVVPVLAPSRGVGAHRLNVPSRLGTDPDVLPGGRNHQGLDAGQCLRVADRLLTEAEVAEPAPAAPAPDPGPARVAAPQPDAPVSGGHAAAPSSGPPRHLQPARRRTAFVFRRAGRRNVPIERSSPCCSSSRSCC